mmetsp:Transcript_16012/g.27394  ORF Transcript_16012/g.27394 Transcript_16012/m.27394 type:complete len:208 (+) Transcript_16012:903-1526(+)
MPFNRALTFSPGTAALHGTSSQYTAVTSTGMLPGMIINDVSRSNVPCSTLPNTAVVPRSLNALKIGTRTGASVLRGNAGNASNRPNKLFGDSVNHGASLVSLQMFAPVKPEAGMNQTSLPALYPNDFKNGVNFVTILSKRACFHCTVDSSILFTNTTTFETPNVLINIACSLVCPSFSNPVSNSPLRAEITNTPTSACAAPAIIFGT